MYAKSWIVTLNGKNQIITRKQSKILLDEKELITDIGSYDVGFIAKHSKFVISWSAGDPPDGLWFVPLTDVLQAPVSCRQLPTKYHVGNFWSWSAESVETEDFFVHGTGSADDPFIRIVDVAEDKEPEPREDSIEALEYKNNVITLMHSNKGGTSTFKATWIDKQLTALIGSTNETDEEEIGSVTVDDDKSDNEHGRYYSVAKSKRASALKRRSDLIQYSLNGLIISPLAKIVDKFATK